jgi:hypothetical protein
MTPRPTRSCPLPILRRRRGPLPAADSDNESWQVLVAVAGTGTGNAPVVSLAAGDWLVSNGNDWVHIGSGGGLATIHVDGVSILGDGRSAATALHVGVIDGGTW